MGDINIQDRMLQLMEFKNITGKQDGNSISKGSIEFKKTAADGFTYAIVKEGNKFYLKKSIDKEKEAISENLDYINGTRNKEKFSYKELSTAKMEIGLKIRKINESVGEKESFAILNPESRQNSILDEGKIIRTELDRNRSLLESAAKIGDDNTGVPEAPSTTSEQEDNVYVETSEVELERDGEEKANPDPTKNMGPYVEDASNPDMQRDIEVNKTVTPSTPYTEKPKHITMTKGQIDTIRKAEMVMTIGSGSTPKTDAPKTETKEVEEKVPETKEPEAETPDTKKDDDEKLVDKVMEAVLRRLTVKKK